MRLPNQLGVQRCIVTKRKHPRLTPRAFGSTTFYRVHAILAQSQPDQRLLALLE